MKSDSRYRSGYSLTLFQDYIYAAFSQSKNVVRLAKTTGNHGTVFYSTRNTGRSPTSVLAYEKGRQPEGGPCARHDCEQLCLAYSSTRYR